MSQTEAKVRPFRSPEARELSELHDRAQALEEQRKRRERILKELDASLRKMRYGHSIVDNLMQQQRLVSLMHADLEPLFGPLDGAEVQRRLEAVVGQIGSRFDALANHLACKVSGRFEQTWKEICASRTPPRPGGHLEAAQQLLAEAETLCRYIDELSPPTSSVVWLLGAGFSRALGLKQAIGRRDYDRLDVREAWTQIPRRRR
ncbi:MAG: hypothetical protein V3V08_01750 [Nannocystaceae bacterium]